MQQLWYFESTLIGVTYFSVVSSCLHFSSVPVNLPQDMFVGTYIFLIASAITYENLP